MIIWRYIKIMWFIHKQIKKYELKRGKLSAPIRNVRLAMAGYGIMEKIEKEL